jgi:DeoR/GlpR family transcriptional regulator of sugar metabolism
MKNDRINTIITFIREHPKLSSKELFEGIQPAVAYATLKRDLSELVSENILLLHGQGKSRPFLWSSLNLQ